MALGHSVNLSLPEVMRILRMWEDWHRYHAESPFYTRIAGTSINLTDELMDQLAKWVILVKQEGNPDGVSQVTHKTWEQLAFPPAPGVG